MTARSTAERAHTGYRVTKVAAVRDTGRPTDAAPIMEIHQGGEIVVAIVDRPELAQFCDSLAGTGVEAIVYHADAVRRAFSIEDAARQRPGDQLRAWEQGDPTAQEVLATVVVLPDGDLSAVVSAYTYEDGLPVFGPEEYDTLIDSTVANDLRRAFREADGDH